MWMAAVSSIHPFPDGREPPGMSPDPVCSLDRLLQRTGGAAVRDNHLPATSHRGVNLSTTMIRRRDADACGGSVIVCVRVSQPPRSSSPAGTHRLGDP